MLYKEHHDISKRRMKLGLSMLSTSALWVIIRDQKLLDAQTWNDSDGSDLSHQIEPQLNVLLARNKTKLQQDISELYLSIGPGGFTGLRSSAAFCLGLSQAIKIPIYGIGTFDLYNKPLFIPLQHQKVANLSIDEALQSGVEFIHLTNQNDSQIAPPSAKDFILGVKPQAHWPTAEIFAAGICAQTTKINKKLELNYGIAPKIFGKR